MNFLFHHALALRDFGSNAAALGAMLPDVWRMADRRVRPRPLGERLEAHEPDETLADVLSGIEHHQRTDRWFHRDGVFLEGERRALALLRGAGFEAPRLTLFAHILWELCLDGALLEQKGIFSVLHSLREGLLEANDGAIEHAVELHHFSRALRPPDERAVFAQRTRYLFGEIARGPWIDGYQTGEGLSYRIQGVRVRLGFAPLSIEDHLRLAGVAASLLEEAQEIALRIISGSPPL